MTIPPEISDIDDHPHVYIIMIAYLALHIIITVYVIASFASQNDVNTDILGKIISTQHPTTEIFNVNSSL